MKSIQRFGGAMFTPVLLFSFAGIMLAISILFCNPSVFGKIASEGTLWYGIWDTVQQGSWTVFNQIELLFVVGLPIGLAKKASGRAAMEALVTYLTWNYFIAAILTHWGKFFGIMHYGRALAENSTNEGLKMIAGIKTFNTSIIGALIIAGIVVYLHNRFFDYKLPNFLGTFQGSAFVVILGFFAALPLAFITCLIWPKISFGIGSLQSFMAHAGPVGVWIYCFLERVLIPTGLHHFIYIPFQYGPAAVPEGLTKWWLMHLETFANSKESLKSMAPQMGFLMYGNEKVFGIPGIALAFYFTAKKENRKKVLALLVPAVITSVLAGITEPIEFTFLFVAPLLWVIHSLLAATLDTTLYLFGVVGDLSGGIIDMAGKNWIPLFQNHWATYLMQIVVGLIFTAIYFFVFRFFILKFNFATPGREADEEEEITLKTKQDYKNKKLAQGVQETAAASYTDPYSERAAIYLDALGGKENISDVTNCATRLRVTVVDPQKVKPDSAFKAGKAAGVVRAGRAFQVIVGLDVPQVREKFEELLKQ